MNDKLNKKQKSSQQPKQSTSSRLPNQQNIIGTIILSKHSYFIIEDNNKNGIQIFKNNISNNPLNKNGDLNIGDILYS